MNSLAPQPSATFDPLILAGAVKDRWRGGQPPDVVAALREYPELLLHRSITVDLAYEEYCLLEEAGRAPGTDEFCDRFDLYRTQIREVIRGHRLLADHPELFATDAPAWPKAGDQLEGLTVVRELGRGGFARAYLALDPETGGRPVVLKLSQASSDEARTLGQIDHPHIVTVYWARRVGTMYAICMPYVGATTLRDVLDVVHQANRKPAVKSILDAICDPPEAISATAPGPQLLTGREGYPEAAVLIAARLADAIGYLHRAGVTHSDIKPSNILIKAGGHPCLIDFNLAVGRTSTLLRCGGTLPYMPPERIRVLLGERGGDVSGVSADVYGLAAVLFEMLTGRAPFEPLALPDHTAVATDLLRRQTGPPPRVRAFNREVSGALDHLVGSCLHPDPSHRPASADILLASLTHLLGRRRRRARAGVAVTVLGLGLAAWPALADRPNQELPVEPKPAGDLAPARPSGPPPADTRPSKDLTPDELVARGTEYLRGKSATLALRDFEEAFRARPGGEVAAMLGFSYTMTGQHRLAEGRYQVAIEQYGFKRAWTHNNRAYSLLQIASRDSQFRTAVEQTNRALALSPSLPAARAARCNRAFARFRLSLDRTTNRFVDPDCLADLEAVMATGPYTGNLYYTAAVILAAGANGREELLGRAVGYLREGVQLGRRPQTFALDPVLRQHLADRPDFKAVLNLIPPERVPPQPNLQVIDPFQ